MQLRKKIVAQLGEAHVIFAIIALIVGGVFVQITPPFWGLDETSHFARVYQLAHGEFIPHMKDEDFGGKVPTNLSSFNDYVVGDLINNKPGDAFSRHDVDSKSAYKNLEAQHFSKQQVRHLRTASYSPVAYAGATVGVALADLLHLSIGNTVLLARLFSLFVYVALVWLALKTLRSYKLKWLIFVIALLPQSMFQASVVTADNMAIGLSLLFTSLLLRLMMSKKGWGHDRLLLYSLVFVAVLLPLVKINYLFLSLGILLVPTKAFPSKKASIIFKGVGLLLSAVVAGFWAKVINGTANPPVSQRPDGLVVDPAEQVVWILHYPFQFLFVTAKTAVVNVDTFFLQGINLMGWNYVSSPIILVVILAILTFAAVMNAQSELKPLRLKLLILATFMAAGFVSIFLALYMAFTPVGHSTIDGIQGRYFLPLVAPLIMLLAFLPLKVAIKDKVAPYIFGFGCAVPLVVSLVYYCVSTY